MLLRWTCLVLLGLVCSGCSSPAKVNDGGADAATCVDKNPSGDCYPTANQGFTARMGTIAGNRIPNMDFQGYLNLDPKTKTTAANIGTIKLSDFYDPGAKKWRVIRIVTSASWCGPCRMETAFLAMPGGLAETFEPQGVVLLQALLDGVASGTAATVGDLNDWISTTMPNITEMLDPGAEKLGVFGSRSLLPFSVTIDARSMEILAKDTGFTDGQKLTDDVKAWLQWTMSNPPQQ